MAKTFGIISVLIMEVTFNKGDLTFNNWGWYPTNVLLNCTFNLLIIHILILILLILIY